MSAHHGDQILLLTNQFVELIQALRLVSSLGAKRRYMRNIGGPGSSFTQKFVEKNRWTREAMNAGELADFEWASGVLLCSLNFFIYLFPNDFHVG